MEGEEDVIEQLDDGNEKYTKEKYQYINIKNEYKPSDFFPYTFPKQDNKQKVELKFMVVPEELSKYAYVKNPVKVKIIDPEKIFLLGVLGESGRSLVEAGISFYFEDKQANWMIENKIAEKVN
jgi:hypothetical protein